MMDWQTMVNDTGISALLDLAVRHRLFLELLAIIISAALIGFLSARWVYRGQVVDRSAVMRREFASWRRRNTQSAQAVVRLKRDRTRAERRLRQSTRTPAADAVH